MGKKTKSTKSQKYLMYGAAILVLLFVISQVIRTFTLNLFSLSTETIIILILSMLGVIAFKPSIEKTIPLAVVISLAAVVIKLNANLANPVIFFALFVLSLFDLFVFFLISMGSIFILESMRRYFAGD